MKYTWYIVFTQLWLALASLCVLDQDHVDRLSSGRWMGKDGQQKQMVKLHGILSPQRCREDEKHILLTVKTLHSPFPSPHSPCVTIMTMVRLQLSSCVTCVETCALTATVSFICIVAPALTRDRYTVNQQISSIN